MGLTAVRLNSALIFNVTAPSEGLFAMLEGCLCLLGAVITVLHSCLAECIEPSIVYIFSFLVEIPLWQSREHRKANNDIVSIVWHRLRVILPPLGVLVAVLDGFTVGTTWELLSLLRDARGLSDMRGVWCKSITQHRKLSFPRVLILVSRIHIHEVPGDCVRRRLGTCAFVNQLN